MTGAHAIPAGEARRLGLASRHRLGPGRRRTASAAIVARLLELPELGGPGPTGWYLALPEEVDLSGAVDELRARGRLLHLPRVDAFEDERPDGSATMCFVAWEPRAPLAANRFGIGEVAGPAIDTARLRVVVVPCVAVDRQGTRVGFGAGYYDRALGAAPGPVRVGVAFHAQVVDRIERREWDVPLDVVVTDQVVLRPGRRA